MWFVKFVLLGVVLSVAASQRDRHIPVQSSAFPRRPLSFPGATLNQRSPINSPLPQPRILVGRNRLRQRINVQQNSPIRLEQRPAPQQVPLPVNQAQDFQDEDLDYFEQIGFEDTDYVLSNNQQQAIRPKPQIVKPVEVRPRISSQPQQIHTPQNNVPEIRSDKRNRQNRPSHTARKGTPSTFNQRFNLDRNTETETPRGQRLPDVQIVKSWSNRDADGSFSYGYINTDGSFKNETKGADCVVRGVYGYVDETTGETLSFPYVSGNPCDPDAPDYYYDYEEGTINSGGQIFQSKNAPRNSVLNRRP